MAEGVATIASFSHYLFTIKHILLYLLAYIKHYKSPFLKRRKTLRGLHSETFMCLLQTNIKQSVKGIFVSLMMFLHLLYHMELLTASSLILPVLCLGRYKYHLPLPSTPLRSFSSTLPQVVNELATHSREDRIDDASVLWKLMRVW